MSVEIIDANYDVENDLDLEGSQGRTSNRAVLDSRRKLENKMDELRLQRELKEFDFDF